jgi:hypothetical protein
MKIKRLLLVFGYIAGLLLPLLNPAAVFAASASMSLSSAGSATKGNYVTVSIHENSGAEPVNAARATLSYPTSLLQFISISSSSAFSIVAANSGGGGSVNVDRGAIPAVTGSQTIASVTFKALTDSGSATVSITSGQVISANSNSDISGGKTGTTIALKAPVAAPPPAPKDTTPPSITKITVSDLTISSATINWTTSEPSTSEVSYGPSKGYGLAAVETTANTVHKLGLNSLLIQPGVTYHYSIKATDGAGNSASSPDATFTTPGANLVLSVIDQNKKPLAGAKVETDNKTATTDKQGKASLIGLTVGKKYGVITYRGDKYPFTANIPAADKPVSATIQIKVPANYTLPVVLGVIVLLIIDYFIGWKTGRGGLAGASFNRLKSKSSFLSRFKKPPTAPPTSGPIANSPNSSGPIIRPNKTP